MVVVLIEGEPREGRVGELVGQPMHIGVWGPCSGLFYLLSVLGCRVWSLGCRVFGGNVQGQEISFSGFRVWRLWVKSFRSNGYGVWVLKFFGYQEFPQRLTAWYTARV